MLNHEINSVEDLRTWANTAEYLGSPETIMAADLSEALKEMKRQSAAVDDIRSQLSKLKAQSSEIKFHDRSRSPSPDPRVNFEHYRKAHIQT